jgi:hypothetical protein
MRLFIQAEKNELRFEVAEEVEGSSFLSIFCMGDIITWQKNQSQAEAQNP